MLTKLKAWYAKLPNAWKAGVNTAWQSALGTFIISLIGFLDQVKEWAGSTSHDFPAVTPLGKAVAALVAGLIGGIVGVIYRGVKPGPVYPAVPPAPPAPPKDAGEVTLRLMFLLVAVGCFAWLWFSTAGFFGIHEQIAALPWMAAGLFFLALGMLPFRSFQTGIKTE